jgi:hypothetical protein
MGTKIVMLEISHKVAYLKDNMLGVVLDRE